MARSFLVKHIVRGKGQASKDAKSPSNADPLMRIRVISGCFFAVALLLFVRLYMVQIVRGAAFSERADRQYVRPAESTFARGTVYFQDKDGRLVSGATLKSGFTLAINPELVTDAAGTYQKLAELMDLDQAAFLRKAAKKSDPYEEVARQVPEETGSQIEALKLPGVSLYREKWRYYPAGPMAAQTLGFIGYRGDELGGRYGLERFYEDVLSRKSENLYANFFVEVLGTVGDTLRSDGKSEGDLVLTIDPTVQATLDAELEKVHGTWQSDQIGGIIMNPKTGAILGMSVYPSFDLNDFRGEKNPAVFSNPLVENVYEMGSIIKALTMAAGIDSGAVAASTTYNDSGSIVLNGRHISNFDGKARGVVDMQQVLNQSLNTGVSFVVSKMGNRRFADYVHAYGFGEKTGIDLPNETSGLLDNLTSPRDVEYATASFGQGIAVTPVETVRALASLANGGTLVTPHLVKRIDYKLGYSKEVSYPEGKRVLKKESSDEITRMLVRVVDEALVGGTAKLEHYSIAAKTGTAQMADGSGHYYDDRYLHSFFGYFPAYDPEFLVFLFHTYPKGAKYASQTLTDPFMETAKFLLNYYSIAPDR